MAETAAILGETRLEYTTRVTSYISIIFTAIGVLGNGVCVKVMLTESVQNLSCSVFFLSLAVSDTVVLLFEVIDDIAVHIPDHTANDIMYGSSDWQCRFGVFAMETCKLVSSWTMAALAVELCMVIVMPRRRHLIYNWNRSFYVTMAVWLICVAGCFPFLVITTSAEEHTCSSKYDVFYDMYSGIVLHAVADCFVPVLFICICSTRSLLSVVWTERKYPSGTEADARAAVADTNLRKTLQAVNVILVTSAIFVFTVCPAHVIDFVYDLKLFNKDINIQQPDWDIARTVAKCILIVNYSTKFIWMFLVGKEFRVILGAGGATTHSHAESFYNSNTSARNGTVRRRYSENGYIQNDTKF